MGSCMGRCLPKKEPSVRYRNNLFSEENEFHSLVEESDTSTIQSNSNFVSKLLSRKKKKCKSTKKPVLELVEGLWNTTDSSYSRLNKSKKLPNTSNPERSYIPLQCLDVRALLSRTGDPVTSSTPVSSLDLEWEHETLPVSLHDPSVSSWAIVPEENQQDQSISDGSTTRPAAQSSNASEDWSRVSSADSLEWDPVASPLHCSASQPDLDTDTQLLLNEIERLTDQALRETGSGLTS